MKQTSIIRTALICLIAVLAFGFTSCTKEKAPSELIIGTWTATTMENYTNGQIEDKFYFDKHIVEYYYNGKVVETDSINMKMLITFDAQTCKLTIYGDDGSESESENDSYAYSIETIDGEKRLVLTDDGETSYAVIDTLTEKDLVVTFSYTDEDGSSKSILRFQK